MYRWITILSGLGMLLLFVVILVGVYFATTLIGKKYTGRGGQSGSIKVLDRIYLGQDKTLVLVKVGQQALLLGVTSHHVERLYELDPADLSTIEEEKPSAQIESRFSELFRQTLKNNWGRNASSEKKGNTHDGEL